MLKQLRKRKTMKRLLWTVAILIIPPFVFWGAGSALRSRDKGSSYAGILFGKKVSFDEYGAAWQAAKNQALLMYGSRINEIYDALNLDQQAWDRLILLHEASRKKVRVSDKEVVGTIQDFPFLQSMGQFDKKAYDLILAQVFRTSARQFEEEIRDSLSIAKLRDSIIKDIEVTKQEVRDAYKNENEKSRIAYILISPSPFKNRLKIDRASVKKYYENNVESFRIPEQANIEYLGFEFTDYQKDIKISDDEVKNYYDAHKDEFDPKKEFKDLKDLIKNILTVNTAKEKALLAAEKIDYILADKTKIFEEVAKENAIPIRETGFFSNEGPIPQIGWFPEIQKIVFKLKLGERTNLIKSNADFAKGYYIIRLKEKRTSRLPNLEEVQEKVENILIDEGAVKLASKNTQRLHKKILELKNTRDLTFEEAAAKIRRKPKYTQPFARNGYIQGLGLASELGESAFDEKSKENISVMKTRAGFCVFRVVELIPISEKGFVKTRTEFTRKTLEAKKMKVLNEWYINLLKKANLKSNTALE
jgi:peptidyl-prolyl cis-trans isomerase D